MGAQPARGRYRGLRAWLLTDPTRPYAGGLDGPFTRPETSHQRRWWQVMCLTGVDYFSTLGYQPGIAALAAGLLSPVATLVLVAVTLFGALPVYRHVAVESPHGQGSIAMLERILPRWTGKFFVLALLGFACTDFTITMTLSAADAAAHIVHNPYLPTMVDNRRHMQLLITLGLLTLLGALFLKGFREAISIAVVLVGVYLSLNLVVLAVALVQVLRHAQLITHWTSQLFTQHPDPLTMGLMALFIFPRLALGLSGFETGVAVMPLIRGDPGEDEQALTGRIRGAHRLLTTAAVIMSVFLVASSFATTLLIPPDQFKAGGKANGRALAYLAHQHFGPVFGTAYDISTVLILWFAGASAMAGLLNLVPQYLPRYGMAPSWARTIRPLVLVFTFISFMITLFFDADVTAQGGAYATGVLVLITSATFASVLAARRAGRRRLLAAFGVVMVVFVYTTVANVMQRPDGVKIASMFIAVIVVTSVLSRAVRATELRATAIDLDPLARRFVDEVAQVGVVHVIANEPNERDEAEYREKEAEERANHRLPEHEAVLFLEVTVRDPSEFEAPLHVIGEERFGYRVLRVDAVAVANTIAAVALHLRQVTGEPVHVYFDWTEGNPVMYLLRYLLFGEGEIAPLTREVLRQAEPNRHRRPRVHAS